MKQALPEYMSKVLTAEPTCSFLLSRNENAGTPDQRATKVLVLLSTLTGVSPFFEERDVVTREVRLLPDLLLYPLLLFLLSVAAWTC